MSDPTPVPPAPLAPPATPVMPLRPLGYTEVSRARRPGVLTAIGVISIAVASLGGLVGAILTLQGFGFFMMTVAMSRATTASAAAASTTAPAPVAPVAPPATGPSVAPPAPPAPTNAHVHDVVIGSVSNPTPAATTAPATSPAAPGLTPAEAQSIIQQAQAKSAAARGGVLNAAQAATLQTLMTAQGQRLVPAGAAQGAVTACYVDSKGTASVDFASGAVVVLGPQGNVVAQTTVPIFPPAGWSINPWALPLFIASSVLSVGLSIFLMVAGIFVLRDSTRGRTLHLVYAGLKIPAAVAAGCAVAFAAYEMISMLRGMTPAPSGLTTRPAFVGGAIVGGLGLVYPVALLIALNTRRVREYYHSVQA